MNIKDISNKTSITKDNRFKDKKALQKMPLALIFGNLILSFLVKMATG